MATILTIFPRTCLPNFVQYKQQSGKLLYEIGHFTIINKRTVNVYHRLCISLQAYLGERYCITVPLVLISFGGTASSKNIWRNGVFARSPRLQHCEPPIHWDQGRLTPHYERKINPQKSDTVKHNSACLGRTWRHDLTLWPCVIWIL